MNIIEKLILESPSFDIESRPVKDSGGKKLKDMSVDQVSPNIVIIGPTENQTIMYPKGFFLMYFFENEEYANDMKNNKKDYLIVPRGGPMGFSGQTSFQKIWRKPEAEGIIGMIQGEISSEDDDEDYIFIDFMTVRSKARRSSITSKMIDLLKQNFPNRKLETSKRTEQGESFWKKYNK